MGLARPLSGLLFSFGEPPTPFRALRGQPQACACGAPLGISVSDQKWFAPQPSPNQVVLPRGTCSYFAAATSRHNSWEQEPSYPHQEYGTLLVVQWVNNPTLTEFCFGMIGRADIEGSKSDVAMNAWPPQASSLLPTERRPAALLPARRPASRFSATLPVDATPSRVGVARTLSREWLF